ncbi:MAG: hypothetical protein VXY77_03670 [Pseudomonadota bacterium]|nr:hypothetical protein [Pseudomonadota bacterium]
MATPKSIISGYRQSSKIAGWLDEVKCSGMLFTSSIPSLKNPQTQHTPICIEGLSFDGNLFEKDFSLLDSYITTTHNLGILDLGDQVFSAKSIVGLTKLLVKVRKIYFLKLGRVEFSDSVLKMFLDWLVNKRISIHQLDLGSMELSLNRVSALHNLLVKSSTIEKLDMSQSYWKHDQIRAFIWLQNKQKALPSRIAISNINTSQVALIHLLSFLSNASSTCRILSINGTHTPKACIDTLLQNLDQDSGLQGCVFNNTLFDSPQTTSLMRLLTSSGLSRVGLVGCEWDMSQSFEGPVNDNSAKKSVIYFEKSPRCTQTGQLTWLLKLGYVIDKEVSANTFWLRKRTIN